MRKSGRPLGGERTQSARRLLPSRPRKSGLPDLRNYWREPRPGFVAGRVGRRSEAATDGVGGLYLLRVRGCPPPPTPPRHSLRSRGEGRRNAPAHITASCDCRPHPVGRWPTVRSTRCASMWKLITATPPWSRTCGRVHVAEVLPHSAMCQSLWQADFAPSVCKRSKHRRFEPAGDKPNPMNREGRFVLDHVPRGRLCFRCAAGSQERGGQNCVSHAKPRICMNRAPSRIQCVHVSLATKVHDRQCMVRAKIIEVEWA